MKQETSRPAPGDVAEQTRLNDARERNLPWRKWGPYLSERQWGTVREDYSDDGNAWNYFSHDHARSRAYRWGEDGIAGFSDDKQRLCFALALWNGRDPISKERLFGLTNSEGNHGEDVKEYYFYLDSTPTHSYMKFLYKYPQAAYPYNDLVENNRRRSRDEFEYELLDTGVFDGDRFFDVFVEYAKSDPEDVLIRITVNNRGPEAATLHLLPTLWFRNTWSWGEGEPKPVLSLLDGDRIHAFHPEMDRVGSNHDEMWDEEDGFFYDLLHLPNGKATRLKVRSMVGLLPLCAASVLEPSGEGQFARLTDLVKLFRKRHPELLRQIAPADESFTGYGGRRLAAVCNKEKLQRILAYVLDENEFLSPYGIRSLSRYHADHPFVLHIDGQEFKVEYLPGESNTGMFGGNSNWRGPIWMPVNMLLIRGLLNMSQFYGDDFRVECPTRSGNHMTLFEVAKEIGRRLASIFLVDGNRRAVYGGTKKFQEDPHWRDHILFYEYFHGDNGAGLGASHQTGWTGLVALCLDAFARVSQEDALQMRKESLLQRRESKLKGADTQVRTAAGDSRLGAAARNKPK
jgi:hypothetical protein